MRALSWSLVGALGGGLVGYAGLLYGHWGRGTVVGLAAAGLAVTFLVPLLVAAVGGGAAGALYNPSGAGTPRKHGYSQAESLAARGLYDQAVAAFEVAIAADPGDPEGYLGVARMHRDRSRRLEESAAWFKRALDRTQPGSGTALLVARELAELYAVKLNARKRAAPVLARLAEERPDTPEGRWAADELRRVKEGGGSRSIDDGSD
jgi:tetratricopeptide (TPR) repeat protein